MPEKPNHLLCFGFGFSARALAQSLPRDQWMITGTSRSAEGCEQIERLGFAAAQFNDDTPLDLSHLDRVTHVVLSVPPGKTGDPVLKLTVRKPPDRIPSESLRSLLPLLGVVPNRPPRPGSAAEMRTSQEVSSGMPPGTFESLKR